MQKWEWLCTHGCSGKHSVLGYNCICAKKMSDHFKWSWLLNQSLCPFLCVLLQVKAKANLTDTSKIFKKSKTHTNAYRNKVGFILSIHWYFMNFFYTNMFHNILCLYASYIDICLFNYKYMALPYSTKQMIFIEKES